MDDLAYIIEFYTYNNYRKAVKYRNEQQLGERKPTERDIAETIAFLGDFGIRDVEIPDLPTYFSLCRWRRDYAKNWLDSDKPAEIKTRRRRQQKVR